MHCRKPSLSALTLVEILITLAVMLMVSGAVFTLMTTGMTLFTQSVAIVQTHSGSLISTERLLLKVATAVEKPILVDETGAPVTGNGPAAGIRFYYPASSQAYSIPGVAQATDTTISITKSDGQPDPNIGDKIVMADLGFQSIVASASVTGNVGQVGCTGSVGSGFSPVITTGVAIPAGSKFFLLRPSAFISVNGVLRHYPRALNVARDGAPAFNNAANFYPTGTLLPASGQTNCFPFQYLDPARRSIDVTLRVRAQAYGSRVQDFYTFQNVKTTLAYRSAVTQ